MTGASCSVVLAVNTALAAGLPTNQVHFIPPLEQCLFAAHSCVFAARDGIAIVSLPPIDLQQQNSV
jgi:hypothetical protein